MPINYKESIPQTTLKVYYITLRKKKKKIERKEERINVG